MEPPSGSLTARVPVTVLAGFLGAGKTTLLNRILAGGHGLRVAVIVNDFGTLDIDSRLVTSRSATTITLDNGCVCCSVSNDLVTQLTRLLEGPGRPEHVLVETSGVSDPGRLLVALRDPHLRRLARVDGVITLVDAAAPDDVPAPALELMRRQVAAADVLVLNKADLVTRAELDGLRARLAFPGARIVTAEQGDVPLELLLGLEAGERRDGGFPDDPTHEAVFATWAWSSPHPLSYRAVREVLGSLPAAIYRAKGFLHLAETPEERVVAHVVGRRVDLRPHGTWDGAEPRSELVFISLEPELDRATLSRRLAATAAARRSASLSGAGR